MWMMHSFPNVCFGFSYVVMNWSPSGILVSCFRVLACLPFKSMNQPLSCLWSLFLMAITWARMLASVQPLGLQCYPRWLVFQCCSQSSVSRAVLHNLEIKSTPFLFMFIRPESSWGFFHTDKAFGWSEWKQTASSQCFSKGRSVHRRGVKIESWTLGWQWEQILPDLTWLQKLV